MRLNGLSGNPSLSFDNNHEQHMTDDAVPGANSSFHTPDWNALTQQFLSTESGNAMLGRQLADLASFLDKQRTEFSLSVLSSSAGEAPGIQNSLDGRAWLERVAEFLSTASGQATHRMHRQERFCFLQNQYAELRHAAVLAQPPHMGEASSSLDMHHHSLLRKESLYPQTMQQPPNNCLPCFPGMKPVMRPIEPGRTEVLYLTGQKRIKNEELPYQKLLGLSLSNIRAADDTFDAISERLGLSENKGLIALSLLGVKSCASPTNRLKRVKAILSRLNALVSLNLAGYRFYPRYEKRPTSDCNPEGNAYVLKHLLVTGTPSSIPLKMLGLSRTYIKGETPRKAIIDLLVTVDKNTRCKIFLFPDLEVLDLHGIYWNGEPATELALAEMRNALIQHVDSNGKKVWMNLSAEHIAITEQASQSIDWMRPCSEHLARQKAAGLMEA